jgi:hypothetical protein
MTRIAVTSQKRAPHLPGKHPEIKNMESQDEEISDPGIKSQPWGFDQKWARTVARSNHGFIFSAEDMKKRRHIKHISP